MLNLYYYKYMSLIKKNRLDLYENINVFKKQNKKISLNGNFLFATINKGFVAHLLTKDDYSKRKEILISDGDVFNINVTDDKIFLLLANKIKIYNYTVTNVVDINITFNRDIFFSPAIDYSTQFKYKNGLLYFENYYRSYVIDTNNSTVKVTEEMFFLTSVEPYRNGFIRSFEKANSFMLYTDIDGKSPRTIFSRIFDDSINVVNTVKVIDETDIIVSFYDGEIRRITLDDSLDIVVNEVLVTLPTHPDTIDYNKTYIIFSYPEGIYLLNRKTKELEFIRVSGYVEDMICNDLLVFYSIKDDVVASNKLLNTPIVNFNYQEVEDGQKGEILLNSHVELNHRFKIKDDSKYNIKISFRGREVATGNVGVGFYDNIFLGIDGGVLSSQGRYMSNIEPVHSLVSDYYGYSLSTHDKDTLDIDKSKLIPRLYIKDVYTYGTGIFFRLRYYSKLNYTIVLEYDDVKTLVCRYGTNPFEELDNPPKIVAQYHDTSLHEDYLWVAIPNVYHTTNYSAIKVTEYNVYDKIDEYNYPVFIEYIDDKQTVYETSDGDIRRFEPVLLNNPNNVMTPETVEKTLRERLNPTFEFKKQVKDAPLTTEDRISVFDNGEKYGYRDFSKEIPYEHKESAMESIVYVNGLRMFKKNYLQNDSLDGLLSTYIADTKLKLTDTIIVEGNMNKIIDSEKFIGSYLITEADERSNISVIGANIFSKEPLEKNISSDDLRVYVRYSTGFFYKRLNPRYYRITVNKAMNLVNVILYGDMLNGVGTEIIVVKDGVKDETLYFDINSSGDMRDILPLIFVNNMGNILTNHIENEEDIEVIVDGLYLYPKIDFTLINDPKKPDMPSIILFRNTLPQQCKLEINFLKTKINKSIYFKQTGSNNEIELNNDKNVFINDSLTVFVENKRISKDNYDIINHDLLVLKGVESKNNILVRFNYEDTTHLELLRDKYKHQPIKYIADNNTSIKSKGQDKFLKDYLTSKGIALITNKPNIFNFDSLCSNIATKNTRRYQIIEYINQNLFDQRSPIIDCNDDKVLDFATEINNELVEMPYIDNDLVINCNKSENKK